MRPKVPGEAEAMVAVRGMILKAVQRHIGFSSILLVCGFAIGLLFRYLFDDPQQRHFGYYVRSGVHGVVLALVGWAAMSVSERSCRNASGGPRSSSSSRLGWA